MCKCTESKASESFNKFVAMNNTLIMYAAKIPNPCPDMLREIRLNTAAIVGMANKVKCDEEKVEIEIDMLEFRKVAKEVAEAVRRATINPANHY